MAPATSIGSARVRHPTTLAHSIAVGQQERTPSGVGSQYLKAGSKGPIVVRAQSLLGIKQSGVYDAATAKAVRTYQERNRLSADGVIGPQTWRHLLQGGPASSRVGERGRQARAAETQLVPPKPKAVISATRRQAAPGMGELGSFGGQRIKALGESYENAKGTVFGGSKDPNDNGIGAFGDVTGPGGKEGVAIPRAILKKLTGSSKKAIHSKYRVEITKDGKTYGPVPIVDYGTSEWVWRNNKRPVLDMTEGIIKKIGGQVVYTKGGKMIGAKGLNQISFRIIPPK